MKITGKVIVCFLSAVIFLYLIVWDYPQHKAKLSTAALEMGLEKQIKELDEQIEKLEKRQKGAETGVYLYFDQVFESCYEQLYPQMKEMGYTGTMVLTDGQLPGNYLQMTVAQCTEMLDNGWELAVGGSKQIDLTENLDDVETEWRAYLEQYLVEIKRRLNVVPTTYCFKEGEYREEFDDILKEYGFKTIRYFGEEELQSEDELVRIRAIHVEQNTDISSAAEDLKNYSTVALCARRVADDVSYGSENIQIEKYCDLLKSIHEKEDLHIIGNTQSDGNPSETLENQIKILKAQKAKLTEQMNEILK